MLRGLTTLTTAAALLAAAGFAGTAKAQVSVTTDDVAFFASTVSHPLAIPDSASVAGGFGDCGGSVAPSVFAPQVEIADGAETLLIEPTSVPLLCVLDDGNTRSTSNTNPNVMDGNTIVANGEDDYTLTFSAPPRALALRLLTNGDDPNDLPNRNSEVLTFYDAGDAVIDVVDISDLTPGNSHVFVGFVSTIPIAKVEIDTEDGGTQNEGFDRIYVGEPILRKEITSGPCDDDDVSDDDVCTTDVAGELVEVPGGITNGSFESDVCASPFDVLLHAGDATGPAGVLTGWTIGNPAGVGDADDAGVDLICSLWANADGDQSLDMSARANGSITQTLTGLMPGRNY
jgi:hypothetical protein